LKQYHKTENWLTLCDEQTQPAALPRLQLVRVELHALGADLLELLGGQAGPIISDAQTNRATTRTSKRIDGGACKCATQYLHPQLLVLHSGVGIAAGCRAGALAGHVH
jgi:hypothetical protein